VPVKESANFNHWILRAVVPRPGYRGIPVYSSGEIINESSQFGWEMIPNHTRYIIIMLRTKYGLMGL